MKAEPEMQLRFMILTAALSVSMIAALLFAHSRFAELPDREPLDPAISEIRFEPVEFDRGAFAPLRLIGAWSVSGDDPRVGSVSALAVEGDNLVALTDTGTVIRFAKPAEARARAEVRDLPAGPGDPRFKWNRDSEAIAADPAGRGWWVAFENRNSLWLYDADFARALERIPVPDGGLDWNLGVEGLAASGRHLLLLPESGGLALSFGPSGWSEVPFALQARRVSGAAALSDRSLLVIERRLTLRGFANALVRLDRCSDGYCLVWRKRLPLGWLDNVEAIAVEPLPSGATRLWLVTDDNGRRPLRTVLIAADLPAQD